MTFIYVNTVLKHLEHICSNTLTIAFPEGEAQELNFSFSELKFGGVEDDAIAATGAQKAAGPLEEGLDGVVIEEGVVHAAPLPLKALEQSIQSICVGVSSTQDPWGQVLYLNLPQLVMKLVASLSCSESSGREW